MFMDELSCKPKKSKECEAIMVIQRAYKTHM